MASKPGTRRKPAVQEKKAEVAAPSINSQGCGCGCDTKPATKK